MNRYLIYILIALFFVPLCYLYPQAYYGVKGISEGDWGIDEVDSPIDDSVIRQEIDDTGSEMESGVNPSNDSQVINATITAFNTVEEQTDDRPCESASGHWICGRTDVVACPPHIPFHTWVEIPMGIDQVFGATIIKRFECLDRTASKYSDRFDISFDKDMEGALNWGIKTLQVKIYE